MGMSSPAIEAAQEELRNTRDELSQARKAVKALLSETSPIATADAIRTVAEQEQLDVTTVQRAIWTLVHDGKVELTETYELRTR
jgi:Fe2+ or Zn2+ uptake regulation protein